jgi:hypothetical protein
MIITSDFSTKRFIVCSVYQGPNEKSVYHNTGSKHFHTGIYIVEGGLDTYPSITSDYQAEEIENVPLESGNYYDLSHTKNKFVTAITGEWGCSMVMFNPILEDDELNVEIVKGVETLVIDATDVVKTVVCISGSATINNKPMDSGKFASINKGTSATLELPVNTVAAIITKV